MATPDLQALLAHLRPRSQASNVSREQSRPDSSTFPSSTQIPSTPPPPFSPTPSAGVHETAATATTTTPSAQNLLSLLNFGAPQAQTQTQTQTETPPAASTASPAPRPAETSHNHTVSASDLVAQLTGASNHKVESPAVPASRPTSTLTNPLLGLLNRSSNASSELTNGQRTSSRNEQASIDNTSSPVPATDETPSMPKEATQAASVAAPLFTYTNPFEALKASRSNTPRTATNSAPSPLPQVLSQSTNDVHAESSAHLEQDDTLPKLFQAFPERTKLTPKTRTGKSPVNQPVSPVPGLVAATHHEAEPDTVVQNLAENEQAAAVDTQRVTDKGTGSTPVPTMPAAEQSSGNSSDAHQPRATGRIVPVVTFPIKAFVSITLHPRDLSDVEIRPESVMEIARLKKDFDQIDRSLAAASSTYITYAFVKNGGMRVIRQTDGADRSVFKNSHDRVFNVGLCTSAVNTPPTDHQAVLGTGVSGAVYYATISKPNNDLFDKEELEVESLIFPAYPPVDENTAGGVLKTRAKRSSRHPEFFAIGRGRNIQIVWPSTAVSPRYNISSANQTVDSETFFYERGLSISTGKAGKDFTFSEDDTVIVSLDKSGRLRFWDIRELVNAANALSTRPAAIEVDTPILSLATASAAEKSWPTSVLFVDKARPYNKGGAQRYVLVGLRQNHTLQLWDIALGKAVQEINFPHANENDGICSVSYHPGSGIITVGHPTRNSIFFIHLSAPRYTVSSNLTQATYVQHIAAKSSEIPKPESTACMSGIREISLGSRGQLRSIELLPVHTSAVVDKTSTEDKPLFELYVTHSRGVTCLAINKADLGWDADNKVILPINAEEEGLVTLKDLKLGNVIEETAPARSPTRDESQQPSKATKKKKKAKEVVDTVNQPHVGDAHNETNTLLMPQQQDNSATEHPTDTVPVKESKKNRKKALQAETQAESLSDQSRGMSSDNLKASAPVPSTTPANAPQSSATANRPESVSMSISGDWLDKELKKIERSVGTEFRKELDVLQQNLRTERAAQDHAAATRQETVLRLVSESLTTNVEKSLSRIMEDQMRRIIVPTVVQSVSSQLSSTNISTAISDSVANELRASLPSMVHEAFQNTHFRDNITASISKQVREEVRGSISHTVQQQIIPVVHDAVNDAATQATLRTAKSFSDQFDHLQKQHALDSAKIDSLNRALQGLASTLQAMSDTQVAFQEQILRERRSMHQSSDSAHANEPRAVPSSYDLPNTPPRAQPATVQRDNERADSEIDEIASMMSARQYEEGSIKWLQSSQPVKLFDELFVRFTPEYLATDVSPLVAFSIGVTVANSLATNLTQRLEWITAAFEAVDFSDNEITELAPHAPQLLGSMVTRLHSVYNEQAQQRASDSTLSLIRDVLQKAVGLEAAFQRLTSGRPG